MSGKKQAADEVQIIQVPNTLRAKIGPGTGIDKALVEKADQAIVAKAGDFLARTRDDIQTLDQKTTVIEDTADDGARQIAQQEAYAITHELRGEAGSYGYKLISTVANAQCRYIEDLPEGTMAVPAIVRAHTDALRAIVGGDISGDGGKVGQELIKNLSLLVAKLQKK
ncbi:MAG: hypothetical protein ACTSX7_09315 [Alphaproteobacteria bacterium]